MSLEDRLKELKEKAAKSKPAPDPVSLQQTAPDEPEKPPKAAPKAARPVTARKEPKAALSAPAVAKSRAPKRSGTLFRLVQTDSEYLAKLLTPACTTHNAAVAKALQQAGRKGMTFEAMVAIIQKTGWKSTSANPVGILGWHLGYLEHRRGLVERV